MKNHNDQNAYEYIIVGAGAAGIQMSYFLKQAGRSYLLLESGTSAGSFFKKYPRRGMLISINKRFTGSDDPEFNLRHDWNSLLSDDPNLRFTRYSSKYFPKSIRLVDYLNDFVKQNQLNVRYNTKVSKISKDENFQLDCENGVSYSCKYLIMATGVSVHNTPDIEGIHLVDEYTTVDLNPIHFQNKKVLIIGKGNSAFETAETLMDHTSTTHVAGPSPIKLAWKTHYVGHLRAVNTNFLDTYQLKSQNAVLDAHIEKIRKEDDKYIVTVRFVRADETLELTYDRVINCTGFRFDTSIFEESIVPEIVINGRFPKINSSWESTNVPNLYFAGTITQSLDFKKSTSAFIHGFRYGVRSLHRLLEKKHHDVEWKNNEVGYDAQELTDCIVKRVNQTSGLYQQFSFMGDVFVPNNKEGIIKHYEEMNVKYVHDCEIGQLEEYFVVTLEYGENHAESDPFDTSKQRVQQYVEEQDLQSDYLHPVIRKYNQGELVSEHHVLENLENEWYHDVHRLPLLNYLEKELKHADELLEAVI